LLHLSYFDRLTHRKNAVPGEVTRDASRAESTTPSQRDVPSPAIRGLIIGALIALPFWALLALLIYLFR
jgi:hypothetical protein